MKRLNFGWLPFLVASSFLSGCVTNTSATHQPTSANSLTSGQVQLTLKKNETTQTEVLEAFGAPNLVTISANGEEVWTYQRHATVAQANHSNVYGTVILFGGSSSQSGFEQSTRTMTLITKFREIGGVKLLVDFQSRSSSF